MIVCRPYIQTRIFNLLIGVGLPGSCSMFLTKIWSQPTLPYKAVYIIFLPFFVLTGFYFLFFHCVWALRCDEEQRTITFFKTFYKQTFPIRQINELTVFKTLRGYDYFFKVAQYSFTFDELDNMPELIAYLKNANSQINIVSPEDHKYF